MVSIFTVCSDNPSSIPADCLKIFSIFTEHKDKFNKQDYVRVPIYVTYMKYFNLQLIDIVVLERVLFLHQEL